MASTGKLNVVYVLPDKLGGVFNFVANLLAHRQPDSFEYQAILVANTVDNDPRAPEALPADRQIEVEYSSPPENLYAYLRRLKRAIPGSDGVLVCNDWVELAMISAYPTRRTVINVTHADADYYYRLAEMHEPWIDCFVALTERIYDRLVGLLPHRRASIVRLPFGVAIPAAAHRPAGDCLRLLYVGRIDREKGVFDLPDIDRRLADAGCAVEWTIQGSGPDEAELRSRWRADSHVDWRGARPLREVLPLYLDHDVVVLPSKSEGLPVALLEGGAAGAVPVVSNLESGVPEFVIPGNTGFRPEVGDVQGFANAIVQLAADRNLLASMSRNVREIVAAKFEAGSRAQDYQKLYARWRELRCTPLSSHHVHYGSRLDKRWIPNAIVKSIRRT